MTVTIDGTDYEIRFGIGFVRNLDKKYERTEHGTTFGLGLESTIPFLLTDNVLVLSELIYEGTCHLKKRPTQAQVDAYIDNCEDIDALLSEVKEELKNQNATRKKYAAMAAGMANAH